MIFIFLFIIIWGMLCIGFSEDNKSLEDLGGVLIVAGCTAIGIISIL